VRKQPARGRRLLEDALAALAKALDATRAPWMVIGAIAAISRGVRRLTTDIDATVRGDAVTIDGLLAELARHAIRPRIDDAAAFAEENLVLLLRHTPTGVDLDVSLAWSAFEHDALATCTEARFGRVRAPMSTPEALVVFKAVAGRPKDEEDAATLLLLHSTIDVARARRRVAELADLAGAPEILEGFERIVARARGAPSEASSPQSEAPRQSPPRLPRRRR
jgi:hypothetical protein